MVYHFSSNNRTQIIKLLKLVVIVSVKILVYCIFEDPKRMIISPVKLQSEFSEYQIRDIICRFILDYICVTNYRYKLDQDMR